VGVQRNLAESLGGIRQQQIEQDELQREVAESIARFQSTPRASEGL